ncbi:hypothetical protein ACT3UN_16085 [Corynebacterium sp. AOP12-C2-36]
MDRLLDRRPGTASSTLQQHLLEANSIAVNRRLGGLGSIQLSAVRAALAD